MFYEKDFSHVTNFTDYMKVVSEHFKGRPSGLKILDMPAGAGQMCEILESLGHEVVCCDINREKPEYVYADMSKPLPFQDNEFDVVICLEGIEHVVDPVLLIRELVRVVRKDGEIVISTPNIANLYSRLQFLFTGIFYQFNPAANPVLKSGEMKDRGHISPLSYVQLRYLFEVFGTKISCVKGSRFKRKVLFPVYLVILLFGWVWTARLLLSGKFSKYRSRNEQIFKDILSPPLLFSRAIILFLKKQGEIASLPL